MPSLGTPKKGGTASLGVGDPESLAKNLDEILSLVPKDDEDEPDIKTPVVKKRAPRKPKLTEEFKPAKLVPKIQISEDTPRKFFKSRYKPSLADENSPPTPAFRTPKVTTTDKKSVKTTDIYSLDDVKPPVKGLKSMHNFEIFDDSQLKTPIKTTSTSSSSSVRKTRSTRKGNDDIKDEVFATPAPASTRKTSTRATSTRKTKPKPESEEEALASASASTGSTKKRSTRVKSESETPSTATRSSKRLLSRL